MSVHPELLFAISPAVLRDLFTLSTRATGGAPPAGSHADLVQLLFTRAPSKKLAGVLARIAPFLTRSGRLALHEAAVASSFPDADGLLALPHADVAVLLALELERTQKAARRRALRRLFALASLRVARELPERSTYELLAESAESAASGSGADAEKTLVLLRRHLGARLVTAWSARDADDTLRFALFLVQPTEARLTMPAHPAPGARTSRSSRAAPAAASPAPPALPHAETTVAIDLIRVFDDGARFALTLAQPYLLPLYASSLSLSLRPSFSLRGFNALSPAELPRVARATRGLTGLDVVGARRRKPGDQRIETRGTEALDAASFGVASQTGYIDRLTLRGITDSGATVDGFLQLPHRVEISDREHEPAFRAAYRTLGVLSPGALPDDARSLAPYEHGDWRWRAVVGDAVFALLCKTKRLVRVQSKHAVSYEYRMHGAGYVVRDVPGEPDLQYALAEDRALGARLVSAKDRVAWRLDQRALATAMMRELGAQPVASPLEVAGVLDLGVVALASGKLRIVYAMAEPPAGWVESLRRAAGVRMTPVVLVPEGHTGEAKGMLEAVLTVGQQLGAERVGRVLGKIAEALDLAHEVEVWRRHDEDILVEEATQTTWVKGRRVPLRERAYGLVLHLAKRGRTVATKDVGASISSAGAPDVTARKARLEVQAVARRAGLDADLVARIIVVEGRLGYRLGLSARVV